MPLRLFVVLLIPFTLSAATITTTWNGQTDGSWTNAANWSAGVASDSVANKFSAIFPDVSPAGTNSVSLASDVTVSGLSLDAKTSLTIQNGKTLTLDSGTFTSQGSLTGAVAVSGAANATFGGTSGGFNGTLTNSSTGTVTFQGTRTPNLVNPAGGVINVNSVNLIGGSIANDGSVTVTGGTLGTFGGNVVVSGAGTLTLAGVSTSGKTLTNSSTIEGYGLVGHSISNSGTITASGGELNLASGINNSGTLQANSGGTLTIQQGASNNGMIVANTGGIVTLENGASGTGALTADGGTLNLQTTKNLNPYNESVVAQNSGKVVANDGSVTLHGQVTVHSTGSLDFGGTASNITVDSGGTMNVHGGIITTLSNSGSITGAANFSASTFTNNAGGTVTLSSGAGGLVLGSSFTNDGSIQMTGGTITNHAVSTLSGSGTLTMNGTTLNGNQVANGAAHTIEGSGGVDLSLINNGKVIASGANLTFGTSGQFTNNGLLSADTGSVFITNTHVGGFANLAGGVLTGGTFEAHGGNAIEFVGAAGVTTSSASISLFDNSQILDYSDTTKDISNSFRINNGTFDLENTAFHATSSGDFENSGHLIVGAGSVFTNGGLQAVTNETGGTISGTGKITGFVENQGVVAPGDDPGQLTVGSYSQSSAGELDIEFATLSSWSSLSVLGDADLSGMLNVFTDAGFDAPLGMEFQILSAGTLTGPGFQSFETTYFHGKAFQMVRMANGYGVEVVVSPEPATFPVLLMVAGIAVVWSRRGGGIKKRLCDVGSNFA